MAVARLPGKPAGNVWAGYVTCLWETFKRHWNHNIIPTIHQKGTHIQSNPVLYPPKKMLDQKGKFGSFCLHALRLLLHRLLILLVVDGDGSAKDG